MELFRLGVAAFIWIGTDPHAERRHAWPDVSVLKGDEEPLSITVQSTRFSHPYVQWVFVFSGCCSSGKKSLFCQKQNDLEADPSTVAQLCVSLIHDKWPSVRVAFLLENSLTPDRPASFVSAESKADHVCLDASSFCPVEHLRSFCFSSLVPWSWECDSTFSREGRFLHLPMSSETVSSVVAWSANESENSLQFLSHHTATAMATSARKQAPQHLERTRVSFLSSSFPVP